VANKYFPGLNIWWIKNPIRLPGV